jgi:flagellin
LFLQLALLALEVWASSIAKSNQRLNSNPNPAGDGSPAAKQTRRFEMATIDVTRIAGNIGALNALNSLQYINNQLAVHQTRLATGKRLNESADDPAGMHLATTFDVRRLGLQTALSSIGDAKNLLSTEEGGLNKIQDILVKMRNKANEAQGDTIGENERRVIQDQLRAYRDEINDIVKQTQWNSNALLNGTTGSSASATTAKLFLTDPSGGTSSFGFTAGSAGAASGIIQTNQSFYATSTSVTTAGSASFAGANSQVGLGLFDNNLTVTNADADFSLNGTTLDGTSAAGSAARENTFTAIDKALDVVKQGIAQIGSFTARLSFKEEALSVQYTNTESAYNRIMNADMAEEQVNASKFMILQQTATAMLSQANTAPQFLLTLFR